MRRSLREKQSILRASTLTTPLLTDTAESELSADGYKPSSNPQNAGVKRKPHVIQQTKFTNPFGDRFMN